MIARNISGKNFQGNVTIELRVAREINFTHPAFAQLGTDFVTTEFCAGRNGHFWAQRKVLFRRLLRDRKAPHSNCIKLCALDLCECVVTLEAITLRAAFHFFKAAVQFRITVGGAAFGSPMSVPMRNRCPSGETSYS